MPPAAAPFALAPFALAPFALALLAWAPPAGPPGGDIKDLLGDFSLPDPPPADAADADPPADGVPREPAAGPPGEGPPSVILAYEPFDAVRPGDTVDGTGGGHGWAGPWGINDNTLFSYRNVTDDPRFLRGMRDGLTARGVLGGPGSASATATNAVSASKYGTGTMTGVPGYASVVARKLETFIGAAGTDTYVGVLMKPEGRLDAGGWGGGFGVRLEWGSAAYDAQGSHPRPGVRMPARMLSAGSCGPTFGFGKPFSSRSRARGNWALWHHDRPDVHARLLRAYGRDVPVPREPTEPITLRADPSSSEFDYIPTGEEVVPGATTLLVFRMSVARDGENALVALHVDPDPLAPEPAPGVGLRLRYQQIGCEPPLVTWVTLVSSGAVTFDEFRVSSTFAGAAGHEPDGAGEIAGLE